MRHKVMEFSKTNADSPTYVKGLNHRCLPFCTLYFAFCTLHFAAATQLLCRRYTIPLSVNTGHEYKFEIGYRVGKISAYGESEFFSIVSPIGEETGGEVGVWCRCGCYQYKAKERRKQYFGAWVECTVCRAWFVRDACLHHREFNPLAAKCIR